MTKRERNRVKELLSEAGQWEQYKARVEAIRIRHIEAGQGLAKAKVCWDEALKEEPYSSAMLGPNSAASAQSGFDHNGHFNGTPPIRPATDKEPPEPPEVQDVTKAQGIEQSNREDMAWVASNMHKRGLKREDAPNEAAHNLYKWVVKEGNTDVFWARYLAIASTKEGQNADRMTDDGREALETVDSVLDKDHGGAELAEDPQPQPAGAA